MLRSEQGLDESLSSKKRGYSNPYHTPRVEAPDLVEIFMGTAVMDLEISVYDWYGSARLLNVWKGVGFPIAEYVAF